MKLEKRIENESVGLTKDETNDLFKSIVMGQDATEWIDTSKGKFKIKFPRAKDLEAIGRTTAIRLNGIPAVCFDNEMYNFMQQIATLDVVVIDGPDWYKLAKKENPNFSWRDFPSDKFIQEVYAKAYKFRMEVQRKIDGDQEETDKGLDNVSTGDNDSKSGVFDGLSGES